MVSLDIVSCTMVSLDIVSCTMVSLDIVSCTMVSLDIVSCTIASLDISSQFCSHGIMYESTYYKSCMGETCNRRTDTIIAMTSFKHSSHTHWSTCIVMSSITLDGYVSSVSCLVSAFVHASKRIPKPLILKQLSISTDTLKYDRVIYTLFAQQEQRLERIMAREDVVPTLLPHPPLVNHPSLITTTMIMMKVIKGPHVQALLPLLESKPQSLPPSSNYTLSPQPSNTFVDDIMDVPTRPSNLILLQSHPSLDITLSLSPITSLDHILDTPSPPAPQPLPQPPLMGHFNTFDYHGHFCLRQDDPRRDYGWFDNADSVIVSSNQTTKDLWDALERQMRGFEYGEHDRKAAILYEYETFKAIEGEQLLDTYLQWKQYSTLMGQTKNLMDINIDALYNILKQNQGDVNDALGYKKKAIVVTSDPLALDAEKTKVNKRNEKVSVSSDSEGSGADDFSELKKITALLAKAFNRRKFYSKPTNNNLRTSSTSQSANKKQEFVKTDDKKVEKKADEKKRDLSKVKCYNCKKEGFCQRLQANKVLLAEDQAWMESSSDSDQEINANMVFMAQIENVLLELDESFSSAKETIAEQTSSLKPYVPNVILEKIIIDLEDEVVSLLDKEKANLKTIESLKSKGFESSENANSKIENQSENDCHVVEKECDRVENSKVIAPGMFKLSVSQSVSPISMSKTSCESNNVEIKLKRKRRKQKSSKQNDKQVNNGVSRANRDYVHFSGSDTVSSVRRPKHSCVIWMKKGSSNTSNVDLSSVSHLKLNKDVKMCDLLDDNNFFIFDDESVRISPVSKMHFRKKPHDSMNIVQICLWIIDSRRSKHTTGNRALLTNFLEKFLGTVRFGNNDFAVIAGYGDVVIRLIKIKKVYYVEGLSHNLFSVGQYCDKGLKVAFRKSTCFVRNEDGVDLLTGDCSLNLYTIALNEVASNSSNCLLAKASSSQSWLWHQRLSNLNFAKISNLVKNNLVQVLPKMKFEKDHLCSACEQGKIHRKHHKSKTAFASNKPLYLLHMDLCGPMLV
nr:integrase, catalytic region, zinc finger, CCHC-type, peptidase aspartic, catalytic [Tanacetum cinerariifolium]